MKTLILIRHAKSNWNGADAGDYNRDLNARGLSDVPIMGQRLQQRLMKDEQQINALLSSPALRANQTTHLLAPALNFSVDAIDWRQTLYLASPDAMLEIIRSLSNDLQTVALVAHNPGITELAEKLTGEDFGSVPTCGVITISLPIDDWCDAGNWAELIHFDFPRKHL